jgi:hypothetical protein
MHEYLGLEGGPPMFRQDFTCPALLESWCLTFAYGAVTRYGASFQKLLLVEHQALATPRRVLGPRSLATTNGISVDVFSSGY